jgi:hypothetical protein
VSEWKSPNLPSPKTARQVKSEPKTYSSFSLTSEGLFTKNLFWQVKQSIGHITVMFYVDCIKMCEDIAPTLATKELAVESQQHTASVPFTRECFTNTNMSVIPHTP